MADERMRTAPSTHLALVSDLKRAVLDTLRPLLAERAPVALLDFPDYGNVGDSAIWLGELACLRDLGLPPPVYTCETSTYHPAALFRRIGKGTILLSGGGNFGDLYERHQLFRERVITEFRDNPVIQLPSSICFRSRNALDRARRVYDAHSELTLLLRDRRSLEIAGNEFRTTALVCPDMAFGLAPLTVPPTPSRRRATWLLRSDEESTRGPDSGSLQHESADWMDEPPGRLPTLTRRLTRALARRPGSLPLRKALALLRPLLARQRVERGCRMLASGRMVVTDRLHGHILSLLLGIPHVVMDNSTGKIGDFVRTWTRECPLTHWADSAEVAAMISAELALREPACG